MTAVKCFAREEEGFCITIAQDYAVRIASFSKAAMAKVAGPIISQHSPKGSE